jgi:cephalosporin-C deacetylase-like acetyl esterase
MRSIWIKIAALSLSAMTGLALFGGYGGKITLDKPEGFYHVGETVVCKVTLLKDDVPLKGTKARMILRWDGGDVETKDFETTGSPVEFSYTGKAPGCVYFGFQVLGDDGKPLSGKGVYKHSAKPTIVTEAGAMFDPENIVSCVREPADFDAFWAARVKEAEAAPLDPVMTKLDAGVEGVELFAVTLKAARGLTATGYLAYPVGASPKSLPAHLSFQSLTYGDANRRTAVNMAKNGLLAFHASWHGFPLGRKAKFYKTEVKKYFKSGFRNFGDKEKWVCSDILFRVLCELKFIKSLSTWNGRELIVSGGSLGGIQSAFAAAIDPDVTLALVGVPAFCECNGFEAGRRSNMFRRTPVEKLKAHPEYLETGFYHDTVNFGKRIKCETFVCTGFADELCPPSNVYAFYNAIPATVKKSMSTNPFTGHYGTTRNIKGNERLRKMFRQVIINATPPDVR